MTDVGRVSAFSALGAALILTGIAMLVVCNLQQNRRYQASEAGQMFSSRLLERTNETLGALYLLTRSIDLQNGTIARFDEGAADLTRDFPLLRALELAPGGVISHVYPMRGNESVLGHDLLIDKTRNREVHLAVSRHQLVVAGPLQLRQGGVGVVARYPVYLTSGDGRDRFWGLSIVVIDFPALLRTAGESDLERLGYQYQICWIPANDVMCKLAIGEQALVADDAIVSKLGIGHAEWRLLIRPRQGWVTPGEYGLAALLVILGSLLVGWSVHFRLARLQKRQISSTASLTSPTA